MNSHWILWSIVIFKPLKCHIPSIYHPYSRLLLILEQIKLIYFVLLQCECEDKYCLEAKQKIDVCRPLVLRGAANATSSCSLSQLICLADAQCATALEYYHRLCRSMFRGRKCSNKCLNSIEILRKQDKAAALTACTCDGNDYDCPRMQNNLARLCYHKMKNHTKNHDRHGERHKKPPAPVEEVPVSGANVAQITSIVALMAATSVSFITWYKATPS